VVLEIIKIPICKGENLEYGGNMSARQNKVPPGEKLRYINVLERQELAGTLRTAWPMLWKNSCRKFQAW